MVIPEEMIAHNVWFDANTYELVNMETGKRICKIRMGEIIDRAWGLLKYFTLKGGGIPNLDKAINYYGH